MWGVWLLLFWVPTLLMSLSGPVRAAGAARVPSRPQTAVIRPVMACHRARLAWHSGEISNIHLPPLRQRLKQRFCRVFGARLTSRSRKAQQLHRSGERKRLTKWCKKHRDHNRSKSQCAVKVRLRASYQVMSSRKQYGRDGHRCRLVCYQRRSKPDTEKCLGVVPF